jgi:hypothetical protein
MEKGELRIDHPEELVIAQFKFILQALAARI